MDHQKSALQKRIVAYFIIMQRLGVLTEYDSMSDKDVNVLISRIFDEHSKDIFFNCYQNFANIHGGIKSRDSTKQQYMEVPS